MDTQATTTRPLVTVCSWCPDAAERTAEAKARGCDVSHGMCPACWPAFRAAMGLQPAPYPGGSK
jgi:hypothetical protein